MSPSTASGDTKRWCAAYNGESAFSILSQVTDEQRYRFDQAARVMAIETAGRLFARADLRLSINFMPNAVYEPNACIQKSLAAAKRAGFPHQNLMFEFTENERMEDPAHVQRIVEAYRKLGFWTALDDFGAGYAGLGLLSRLQPDLIKIDMELLRDIHLSRASRRSSPASSASRARSTFTCWPRASRATTELTVLRAARHLAVPGLPFRQARPDGASGMFRCSRARSR